MPRRLIATAHRQSVRGGHGRSISDPDLPVVSRGISGALVSIGQADAAFACAAAFFALTYRTCGSGVFALPAPNGAEAVTAKRYCAPSRFGLVGRRGSRCAQARKQNRRDPFHFGILRQEIWPTGKLARVPVHIGRTEQLRRFAKSSFASGRAVNILPGRRAPVHWFHTCG